MVVGSYQPTAPSLTNLGEDVGRAPFVCRSVACDDEDDGAADCRPGALGGRRSSSGGGATAATSRDTVQRLLQDSQRWLPERAVFCRGVHLSSIPQGCALFTSLATAVVVLTLP